MAHAPTTQMLGIDSDSAEPSSGYRMQTQRYVEQCDWRRFFDVVSRLWDEFRRDRREDEYRDAVNGLLAGHSIVWQMTELGRFERVLPSPVAAEIRATIAELRRPGYEAARQRFGHALDAFNAIPRRDPDAAFNAFLAMESAAKIRLNLPNGTFHDALMAAGRRKLLNNEVQQTLDRVNTLRHEHLGHGVVRPFVLSPAEVDFVYLICAAGARLFARL